MAYQVWSCPAYVDLFASQPAGGLWHSWGYYKSKFRETERIIVEIADCLMIILPHGKQCE